MIGEAVVAGETWNEPADGVDFLGWIGADQIDGYYRSADLVVVPSRWEAFGLVVVESYRNGTPVLTSDRGGLSSLLKPGVTGFTSRLCEADFALALIALEKAKLVSMRACCTAIFTERYHAERLGREILALYAEVTD